MTDNMRAYYEAICEVANVDDIGDVSDGFHTFNQLYHQRAMLFAALVNQNRDISWKTRKHEDGKTCFGGGWFLVTIDTPEGAYGYHYEDKYWDMFHCVELEKAKHWDGYTEEDVGRLMSLPDTAEWIYTIDKPRFFATFTAKDVVRCSKCGNTLDMDGVNAGRGQTNFCPNCGKKMKDGGRAK